MLQRTLPAGFVAPSLPIKTEKLSSGSQWLHEIKHDGFRIIARKNGAQVGLRRRSSSASGDGRVPALPVAQYLVDHIFVYRRDQNLPYKFSDA